MTRRLRRKFLLINMVLVSMVLLIVFIGLYVSTQRRLVMDSAKVMERYFDGGQHPAPKLEFDKMGDRKNFPLLLSFCAVLDSNGNLVSYQSDNMRLSEDTVTQAVDAVKQKLENKDQTSGVLHGLGLRYLAKEREGQCWIAFVDRTQEIESMRDFVASALLIGAGGLVALFFISFFLSAWVVRPVEKAWTQQKQFVADASHELKTPLTVILANTGILLSHKEDTVANQQRWVLNTQEEAANMKKLVEDMLFLARNDAGVQMVYSRVNFSDVVWSAVLPFESVAFEQGLQLDSDIAEDLTVMADEGKLRELVRILLDNACKYCAPKGKIFVRLEKQGEKIFLYVRNSSEEKLQQDQLEKLFERFYRADKSRNREKGSYGLGLAIAKSITQQHHGKIAAHSTAEGEVVFTVTLPWADGKKASSHSKKERRKKDQNGHIA